MWISIRVNCEWKEKKTQWKKTVHTHTLKHIEWYKFDNVLIFFFVWNKTLNPNEELECFFSMFQFTICLAWYSVLVWSHHPQKLIPVWIYEFIFYWIKKIAACWMIDRLCMCACFFFCCLKIFIILNDKLLRLPNIHTRTTRQH